MGQVIGLSIFWIAGMVAVYFWLRDDRKSALKNLQDGLWWVVPIVGLVAGFVIYTIAAATTH